MHRLSLVIGVAILAVTTAGITAQAPVSRGGSTIDGSGRVSGSDRPASDRGLVRGTRADLTATIRGNALNFDNGALSNTKVRLRDARFGRVIDTQVTDNAGVFTFTAMEPGSYIVELMGEDDTVLAASQIIDINAGEAATTIVKMPFRRTPLAGVFGNSRSSAWAVMAEAAAAGVLATTIAGSQVSQRTF
jgi:hypothetical protein